ncbi:hypothetical protein A2U01_0119361, partial [Trifolium medium]|nr:hypothetical protein [Trifolium medium]
PKPFSWLKPKFWASVAERDISSLSEARRQCSSGLASDPETFLFASPAAR